MFDPNPRSAANGPGMGELLTLSVNSDRSPLVTGDPFDWAVGMLDLGGSVVVYPYLEAGVSQEIRFPSWLWN